MICDANATRGSYSSQSHLCPVTEQQLCPILTCHNSNKGVRDTSGVSFFVWSPTPRSRTLISLQPLCLHHLLWTRIVLSHTHSLRAEWSPCCANLHAACVCIIIKLQGDLFNCAYRLPAWHASRADRAKTTAGGRWEFRCNFSCGRSEAGVEKAAVTSSS